MHLELNQYTITSQRLPESFDGYKIAHVSDLHNAEFGESNAKLLELIKEAEPDIIAITGDVIDSHRTDIDIALRFAAEAVKIAPCYYVSGNHEGLIDSDEYARLVSGFESIGVTVLDNKEEIIELNGEKISLLGTDVPLIGNEVTAEGLAQISSADCYTILLCHRPDYFEEFVRAEIDLTLCGHAHGGQFRLPFIGAIYAPNQGFFPEYDSGLYSQDDSVMVVSRGLGNSTINLRFNNRPELVVIELKTERRAEN